MSHEAGLQLQSVEEEDASVVADPPVGDGVPAAAPASCVKNIGCNGENISTKSTNTLTIFDALIKNLFLLLSESIALVELSRCCLV